MVTAEGMRMLLLHHNKAHLRWVDRRAKLIPAAFFGCPAAAWGSLRFYHTNKRHTHQLLQDHFSHCGKISQQPSASWATCDSTCRLHSLSWAAQALGKVHIATAVS